MNVFSPVYVSVLIKAKIKQLLRKLPFLKSTDYTAFLIIGHPRTGTSLLHTYLNSHWNILSLNEPLRHSDDHTILFKKQSNLIKAAGFKYFYEYINDAFKKNTLIKLLKGNNIKIIKIERKNFLRVHVSRCIAEKTNTWSSTEVLKHSIGYKKVVLTKLGCLEAFEHYKNVEQETDKIIEKFNTPVFKTNYETLVSQPEETMFAIQKFLGVAKQTPQSLLVRQNAEPLDVLIENYKDLKVSFSGSEFEYFFDVE